MMQPSPIETLLARLEDVRQSKPDTWLARCPAHDDKHPSLSVRVTGDGTVLVKCFSQCSSLEVVQAVGLTLANLFPTRYESGAKRRFDRRVPPLDALKAIDHEALLVSTIAGDVYRRQEIDTATWDRLLQAVSRIGAARGMYL